MQNRFAETDNGADIVESLNGLDVFIAEFHSRNVGEGPALEPQTAFALIADLAVSKRGWMRGDSDIVSLCHGHSRLNLAAASLGVATNMLSSAG